MMCNCINFNHKEISVVNKFHSMMIIQYFKIQDKTRNVIIMILKIKDSICLIIRLIQHYINTEMNYQAKQVWDPLQIIIKRQITKISISPLTALSTLVTLKCRSLSVNFKMKLNVLMNTRVNMIEQVSKQKELSYNLHIQKKSGKTSSHWLSCKAIKSINSRMNWRNREVKTSS